MFLKFFAQALFIMSINIPLLCYSQNNEDILLQPDRLRGGKIFKPVQSEAPQSQTMEVIGISQPMFTVSNIADGTSDSYQHFFRITYNLQIQNAKSSYILVFYNENEKIPYAVKIDDGATYIYIPLTSHNPLKEKLDQALLSRKKVTLKVNHLNNGLREAIWIF